MSASSSATTGPSASDAAKTSASVAQSSLSAVIASASKSIASESSAASGQPSNPAWFKYVGIALAILSGFLIGSSFVFKKKGLLAAQRKYSTTAGEGVGYLKSPLWWFGKILMIIGEVANLGGYSFAPAILVTPFGALSVVVCAVLSAIFLQETLTLFGKIGCFLCVIGSVIIALNGPSTHNSGSIVEFRKLFVSVGFLVWTGICIAASVAIIIFVAPKYGKRWMMVYISICSLLGGLSVSTTSGLGSAIVLTIRGDNQLKNWFFYVLLVFVAVTLVMEILFLNKALELFNTAMVTPAYFVTFTSASIISTIILFKGLDASASAIVTLVMGFLVICTGIVLLQLSKVDPEELEEKNVPGLDRSTTLLMRASKSMVSVRSGEKGSSTALEDPGIDTMRGAGGIIGSLVRARSSRQVFRASADEYAKLAEEGSGLGMSQLNTGRRPDLERFTLHDAPMPGSSSMRSANAGRSSSRQSGASRGPDGMLSPQLPPSPNMPKRGMSMVSFTSESLAPHGHHAAGPSQGPHAPSSGSAALHGPSSGILAQPSTAMPHDYSTPTFLGGSNTDRQLSNIAESIHTGAEGRSRPTTPGATNPSTPYLDPFATAKQADYLSRETGGSSPSADAGGGRGVAIPRADRDLRHIYDPSVEDSSTQPVPAGGYFSADPEAIAPGLSPTTSLDYVADSADQSYSPPVRRTSPQRKKQYTDRAYPGTSTSRKASADAGRRSQSGASGSRSRQRERLEEEELLSPSLGGGGDDSFDQYSDDEDEERRNSIRVVGGGESVGSTQVGTGSNKRVPAEPAEHYRP